MCLFYFGGEFHFYKYYAMYYSNMFLNTNTPTCIYSYEIMLACWNTDPNSRPTFSQLKSKFDHMLRSDAEYIYFLPVNGDQPCYQPENAPEGLTLPTRTSPNANGGNRLSSYVQMQMAPTANLALSSPIPGRSSGQTSPGQHSPRSISPAFDPSPRHTTSPNMAQRSASMLLSGDAGRDKKKRVKNVYVDNPSKRVQNLIAQARPTSALIPQDPGNGEVSIQLGRSNPNVASSHDDTGRDNNSCPLRSSSASLPDDTDTWSGNDYVNVSNTRAGIDNGLSGMEVANPLFGREISMDENGSNVPEITVTEN